MVASYPKLSVLAAQPHDTDLRRGCSGWCCFTSLACILRFRGDMFPGTTQPDYCKKLHKDFKNVITGASEIDI